MDAGFKLEEVGVNEPLDESGGTFSDFEPAAIGGNRPLRRGSTVLRRPSAPG
jgi:hypothetical protein